MTLWKVSKSQT